MKKSLACLSIGRYIYRPMHDTPFFSHWRSRLAPMGRRTPQALLKVRAYTLAQLESSFGPCLPPDLFPKPPKKENSRDPDYTLCRTFCCMLCQAFLPKASDPKSFRR